MIVLLYMYGVKNLTRKRKYYLANFNLRWMPARHPPTFICSSNLPRGQRLIFTPEASLLAPNLHRSCDEAHTGSFS